MRQKKQKAKNSRILPSGSIQVVETHVFSDGSKRRLYGTGITEKEAYDALYGKIDNEQHRIDFGEALNAGETTISLAIDNFLKQEQSNIVEEKGRPLRDATIARDTHVTNSLLHPFSYLMKIKVKDLTPMLCMKWREEVGKKKSLYNKPFGPDYKNRALFILKSSVDPYFIRTMQQSPTASVKPWKKPHKQKTEENILLPEEIRVFLDYCREHFDDYRARAAWLQIQIFIRPGELLALKVKDYDPIRHLLHIQRTITKKRVYDKELKKYIEKAYISTDGEVKTMESDRYIPLSSSIEAFLQKINSDKQADSLIFPCTTGNFGDEATYNKWFKKALKACGIGKNLHAHNLRTSGISFAAYAGADLSGVSKMAGHSSQAVTQEFYTAVYDRKKKEAADKLADAFSGLYNDQ